MTAGRDGNLELEVRRSYNLLMVSRMLLQLPSQSISSEDLISSRISTLIRLIASTPRPTTRNTRPGSSPFWIMRCRHSSAATKCRQAILVIEWRGASSKTPSVSSPLWQWAIGMRAIEAAEATSKVSKRSPSTSSRSGYKPASASARPIIPSPNDLVISPGVSKPSSISTFRPLNYPVIVIRPEEQDGIVSATAICLPISPIFTDCLDKLKNSLIVFDDNIRTFACV
jgi:hypothetical protein